MNGAWGTLLSVAIGGLMVWITVRAARRTDEPWWKIWLLARGIIPTADELRNAGRDADA